MHWPDIFFRARKPRPDPELPSLFPAPLPTPKAAAVQPQSPAIKPVPAAAAQVAPTTLPTTLTPLKNEPSEVKTRTLPVMHGVVLRPPSRLPAAPMSVPSPAAAPLTAPLTPSTASSRPPARLKNIEQLMAEADPVRTLSQTGNVRMLKHPAPEPGASSQAPTAAPAPVKVEAVAPTPPIAPSPPSPWPSFAPAAASPASEVKKVEPAPVSAPAVSAAPMVSQENDSPFILKPVLSSATVPKIIPPTPPPDPPAMPFGSIFRRKAKMTEVARIVLPPKREESESTPAPTESSHTVVPPAFPVAAMTARANQPSAESLDRAKDSPSAPVESVAREKIVLEEKPVPSSMPPASAAEESGGDAGASPPDKVSEASPEPEKTAGPEKEVAPISVAEAKPGAPSPDIFAAPKVDPEAHKPEPPAEPAPKVDPQAHRPMPEPAAPMPAAELAAAPEVRTPEKREFHLANGERVAGTVLSETPEAVYIDHGTLGVLTIPRAQIAKRLVEIILINGDRIVGDIMAETSDTLYVRHASLGMLTVPRAQRSTRVVEAILKDGDRILGEVLTETDTFTVIRSATLGTITVPHSKISMLNRKIEQIELKALPAFAPEIKDKPSL